ncbi:MAG: DUF3341 domain-containing protein [Planctomycetes bacterium]|nr:DUF3341 domain-containing protein [Planctomycetota bacterium]
MTAPVTRQPDTAPAAAPRSAASPGKVWGLMAEFDTPAAITAAAHRVREQGFRWWDCHVPFPVHGLDKAMGVKPTILPILVFFGGLTGAMIGAILQWFTNAESFDMWALVAVRGYDFMISGKPFASVPAWIPVIFELTILLAALSAAGLMLLFNGLPLLYHPTLKSERFARATDDRFFVVIEARDPKFSRAKTEAFLESLDPLSIEALEP